MFHRALRVGLMAAGALLACSLGCQTESKHGTPGALPASLKADVAPRLNAATYFAHAHLLERQGNLEQAVEQYRRALGLAPNFVSGRDRLGVTLNKLGRHAEATAEFRKAVQVAPADASLRNNLGFSLYLEGSFSDAADELRQAVTLKPDFPRAHMNYGVVLATLAMYDEALTEFCLATTKADAYYNLAVLQSDAGQFAEAAGALETALRLNPDFEAAREQLRVVARLAAEAESAAAPTVAEADTTGESAVEAESPTPASESEVTLVADEQLEEVTASPAAVDPLDEWRAEIETLLEQFLAGGLQGLTVIGDWAMSESIGYCGRIQPESWTLP